MRSPGLAPSPLPAREGVWCSEWQSMLGAAPEATSLFVGSHLGQTVKIQSSL